MSPTSAADDHPVVLAPQGTRILAVLLGAVAAAWLTWSAVDSWSTAVRSAPFVLLFGLLVYLVAWRPSVLVTDQHVVMRNVFRDVAVPFAALEEVRTRFGLQLGAGGRRFSALGAPPPGMLIGRASRVPAATARAISHPMLDGSTPLARASSSLGSPSGAAALLIRTRWETWLLHRSDHPAQPIAAAVEGAEAVVVQWNWWIPFALVLLAIGCAAALVH